MIEFFLALLLFTPFFVMFVLPTLIFVVSEVEQVLWLRRTGGTRTEHIHRMSAGGGDQESFAVPITGGWKSFITTSRIMAALGGAYAFLLIGLVIQANVAISNHETLTPEAATPEAAAHETNAPGRFVTVEGHRLHVATLGDINADPSGAPLLLIHGFAPPGHTTFFPWAEKLAAKRALILPDLLGYGFSERVTTPGLYYSQKAQAAAIAAMLDDLGVAQVDVVGHSYGGVIAAQFAVDYPQRVRRIIFMDAAIYLRPSPITEAIIQLPLGIGRAVAWHAFGGGPFSILNCAGQPGCVWTLPTKSKGTIDAVRASMSSHRRYTEGAVGPDDVTKIKAPALVLWGADDVLVPVTDGQRLALVLKVPFASIADARHMPYRQQPDKVAAWVLDFLNPPK